MLGKHSIQKGKSTKNPCVRWEERMLDDGVHDTILEFQSHIHVNPPKDARCNVQCSIPDEREGKATTSL